MSSGHPYHLTAYVPWLKDKCRNIYSQFGEDGLIEACFNRYGETNQCCFEFGAGDGKTLSNTRHLLEHGWSGIWIEHHPPLYEALVRDKPSQVIAISETVTPENINRLLDPLPYDTDFGSIDVDGDDYWIWQAMTCVKPRIMLVEYSPYQQDQSTLPERSESRDAQAPLDPIVELGKKKGYELLATTYCNCLFARSDLNDET